MRLIAKTFVRYNGFLYILKFDLKFLIAVVSKYVS